MSPAFLFDIGVVLLNMHYEEALRRIAPLCNASQGTGGRDFFHLVERDPVMADFERGKIGTEAFFRHFSERAGFHGTFEQFRDIWCCIFSENTPMLAFAQKLAQTHDLFFVTNTGPLHVPRIFELFPSLRFHKDCAASYALGAVKPEREFYERALKQFKRTATECVLVDDRPENVEGARACGLHAILYTSPEQTIADIQRLLGSS